MEINKKLGLQINNSVRKSLYRAMRAKRILSWITLVVSLAIVVSPYLSIKFKWYDDIFWFLFLLLPVSLVFLVVSIYTFSSSKSVLQVLQSDSQAAFDEAMSKWSMRGVVAFVGYIFFYIILGIISILCLFIICFSMARRMNIDGIEFIDLI